MTDRIHKTLRVPLDRQTAFDLFTRELGDWWPVDSHSLAAGSGERPTDVTVEPRAGGKITETLPDGTTADWATITDWRPGERLRVNWYVGRDPSEATDLTVDFTAEGDVTRVDLTHDGFDRLGPSGEETCASYRTGWDTVLGTCYGGHCLKRAA